VRQNDNGKSSCHLVRRTTSSLFVAIARRFYRAGCLLCLYVQLIKNPLTKVKGKYYQAVGW
jgi:hypothetical protein